MAFYQLLPFFVPKPWGGGHLDQLARPNNGDEKIGEMVLLSDLPQFSTKLVEYSNGEVRQRGSFAEHWSKTLCEQFLQNYPDYVLDDGHFPFMVKILSTSEPLSIQVHPADEDIAGLGLNGRGKSEAWFMLDADQDAKAYLGLREGSSYRHLQSEIEGDPVGNSVEENILRCLQDFSPRYGDVFELRPGLIHGTKGRLLFYEIQQPSDHTFRIYDFGRPRPLHLEQAAQVVRDIPTQKRSNFAGLKNSFFQVEVLNLENVALDFHVKKPFTFLTYWGAKQEARVTTHQNSSHKEYKLTLDKGSSVLFCSEYKISFGKNHGLVFFATPHSID